jgi:hypothetical protein
MALAVKEMKVFYALQSLPEREQSIFLAGPTPRSKDVESWRPEALAILADIGYQGNVFVPEPEGGEWADDYDYDSQISWELKGLNIAGMYGCIVFWVPRNLENMPAFTTNVEFGLHVKVCNLNMAYGRPDNAPGTRYLDSLYLRYRFKKPQNSLKELLEVSINPVRGTR